jgi:hypothetical protein
VSAALDASRQCNVWFQKEGRQIFSPHYSAEFGVTKLLNSNSSFSTSLTRLILAILVAPRQNKAAIHRVKRVSLMFLPSDSYLCGFERCNHYNCASHLNKIASLGQTIFISRRRNPEAPW